MTIPYLSLKDVNDLHSREICEAVEQVIHSGWYLKGEATRNFERHYAGYIGTRHCVACGNGLDALTLIFRAYKEMGRLKDGDEVIVPANTYIATILSLTENGLVPVLVEPDIETLQIDDRQIERHITARTRAILIVHLYGRCAHTRLIAELCLHHHLLLVEDNAQAAGCCSYDGIRTGALGDAAAHSFYPTKNLGALGDAGAITTNDDTLADVVRSLGNYGSSQKYVFPYQGRNSRMDELQAAALDVKLKYLDAENKVRKELANFYLDNIDNAALLLPHCAERDDVWHIFPVLCQQRDKLRDFLKSKGIGTEIHYPIPPHKQACYKEWNQLTLPITERISREELSIPLNQTLSKEECNYVVEALNSFSL